MKSGCQVAVSWNMKKRAQGAFQLRPLGKDHRPVASYSDLPKPSGELLTDIAIHIGEEPYMLDGIMMLRGNQESAVLFSFRAPARAITMRHIGANKPFKDLADGLFVSRNSVRPVQQAVLPVSRKLRPRI
jgi:hypothetical protein